MRIEEKTLDEAIRHIDLLIQLMPSIDCDMVVHLEVSKRALDIYKDCFSKKDKANETMKILKDMGECVFVSDLVDRFKVLDEAYEHEPWNLNQIVSCICHVASLNNPI